jgi:hypothetical protein
VTAVPGDTLRVAAGVDTATITPTERAQATTLLALAANQPLWHTNPHTAVFHAACTHRDVALTATT